MKTLLTTAILGFAAAGLLFGCGPKDPLRNYPNLRNDGPVQPQTQLFTVNSQDTDVEVGARSTQTFYIRSAYPNSEVTVTRVHLNDSAQTEVPYDTDSNTYSLVQDGVNIQISCDTASVAIQELISCEKGACVQSCSADVKSACSSSEGPLDLVISTESKSGSATSNRDLIYKLNLKGQAKACVKSSASTKAGSKS